MNRRKFLAGSAGVLAASALPVKASEPELKRVSGIRELDKMSAAEFVEWKKKSYQAAQRTLPKASKAGESVYWINRDTAWLQVYDGAAWRKSGFG